ncbi:MAG: hypothetical protein IJ313_10615 [Clostridia bacterium]|nr:hypothetical protein [Clostridia bacterium]
MAFGHQGWGNWHGSQQPMQEQMAQMRAWQTGRGGPWPQNKPLYAVMVDGEQAARNYFVPPGEKAIMFDKERPAFYIKEVDEYNATNFEAFQYDKIPQESEDGTEYVTHAQLKEILAQLGRPAQQETQKEETRTTNGPMRMRRAAAREAMNDEQPGV